MSKTNDDATRTVQKAMQQLLGETTEVKSITAREIRDFPEWTTKDDVLEAAFKFVDENLSAESYPNMRKAFRGP